MPVASGWATPRTSATATAASMALTPRSRMFNPARVAIGDDVASAACVAAACDAKSGVVMKSSAMPYARTLLPPSARRPIAVVDDLQSLQSQLGVDLVDVLAVFDEERSQSARRDHALDAAHFFLDARENAVDQREISEIQTRLHVDDRVRADDMRRPFDVDARQPRRAREQRFGGDVDAGRDHAAGVVRVGGDEIERRSSSEVDDDQRSAVRLVRSNAVDDAIGADFLRVIHVNADSRFHSGLDEQRLHAEVLAEPG